jgi:hypothetical protein
MLPDQKRRIEQAELVEAEARLKKMLEIAGIETRSTYNPDEIKNLFRTSLSSVYRLVAEGALMAIYVGKNIKIDYQSLVIYIKENNTAV